MVSTTRLYGAVIAVTSGVYSLWSAVSVSRMVASAWIMALLGVIVIIHGGVLVTSMAERIGPLSGPLMIAYAVVMLVNQVLLSAGMLDPGRGMGMTGMAGSGMTGGGPWDAGMVALAIVMLASGVIMSSRREADSAGM